MNMRHEMEGDELVGGHDGHREHHQHEPAAGEGAMNMGMRMYFHSGLGDLFLFYGIVIDTNLKLWLAAGLLFGLALGLEWLHYLQTFRCECGPTLSRAKTESGGVKRRRPGDEPTGRGNDGRRPASGTCCAGVGWGLVGHERRPPDRCNLSSFWHRHRSRRSLQTLLQLFRTALSFVLMLAAMTYNVCLIFAILSGSALGFYVFFRPYNELEQLCH